MMLHSIVSPTRRLIIPIMKDSLGAPRNFWGKGGTVGATEAVGIVRDLSGRSMASLPTHLPATHYTSWSRRSESIRLPP